MEDISLFKIKFEERYEISLIKQWKIIFIYTINIILIEQYLSKLNWSLS